jgi:putative ABC transport system substrate-binding protein
LQVREEVKRGNATGINFFSDELTAKRLGLLRELVPAATRVAVLVNPANAAATPTMLPEVEAAARALGLQIQVVNANTSREIDAVFTTFTHVRPDALFVTGGPFLLSRRSNWPCWRRATRSPPRMGQVSMSRSAG